MNTPITPSPKSTTQQRGRPRVSGDMLIVRQAPVLAAAGRLLATRQSTDISVELLLQETGTSRPTFYRWFPNGMSQVFDLLIAKANTDLMVRIVSAISRCDNFDERIRAGIKAYFDWGWAQGPVVSGIYREGFTEGSIAQRYRRQTLDVVIGMINQQAEMLGQNILPPRMIETLVSWVESAGAVVFRPYPVKQIDVEQQCELTIQMFLATVSMVLKNQGITLR
jgi:AcrR family transcriptional regulator